MCWILFICCSHWFESVILFISLEWLFYFFSFFYLFLISSYFNGDQLKIVGHNGILIHYKIDLIRCIHALIFMMFLFHLYNSIHFTTDYVDRQRQLPLCIKYHTLSSLYWQSENEQFFFPLYTVNIGMYQEFDCRATMLWWRLLQHSNHHNNDWLIEMTVFRAH